MSSNLMPPQSHRRLHRGARGLFVGIGLCALLAFLTGGAALRAQEINDNLPAPRVLIPRTNLVPADADYNAVTPRMMKPSVPLRNDPSVAASSASATSADAPRKPKRGDSMASAYDAAPEPASTSASSAGGSNAVSTAASSSASSGAKTAAGAKKNASVAAQTPA
ncbi:MAG TPA: hypothetical protein VIM58_02270, partial [Candidatus Methylacidiphilales bacterium]